MSKRYTVTWRIPDANLALKVSDEIEKLIEKDLERGHTDAPGSAFTIEYGFYKRHRGTIDRVMDAYGIPKAEVDVDQFKEILDNQPRNDGIKIRKSTLEKLLPGCPKEKIEEAFRKADTNTGPENNGVLDFHEMNSPGAKELRDILFDAGVIERPFDPVLRLRPEARPKPKGPIAEPGFV